MEFFLMNNKLVTAVLCFESHICNQVARIRVKHASFKKKDCKVIYKCKLIFFLSVDDAAIAERIDEEF